MEKYRMILANADTVRGKTIWSKDMIIFRLGNDERPACPEDIKDFRRTLNRAIRTKQSIVCHHAIDILVIPEEYWGNGKTSVIAAKADPKARQLLASPASTKRRRGTQGR